jgi:hydrogenase expression/formation protein HypC
VTRDCRDDVCITCSDTAVQVSVLEILPDDMAVVRATSSQGTPHEETVSIALVTARPGDTILVHAKEAIAVVSR